MGVEVVWVQGCVSCESEVILKIREGKLGG